MDVLVRPVFDKNAGRTRASILRACLASAFDAIFESLSGTVQQQFDGPFAAMKLPGDLDQFLLALVMEFDPLSGTRAETVHAARQMNQPVIVVGPQGIGRENRFEFEA